MHVGLASREMGSPVQVCATVASFLDNLFKVTATWQQLWMSVLFHEGGIIFVLCEKVPTINS